MVCSATLFLPVPAWGAIAVAGGFLNPVLLGLAAGAGAATGELTGYIAGRSGRLIVGDPTADTGPIGRLVGQSFSRLRHLVGRHGFLTLFLASRHPEPAVRRGPA